MPFEKGNKLARGGVRKNSGRKTDKVMKKIKDLAGQYREEAINRLAFWMRSDNAKASVSAAVAILDRSDGKPNQMLSNDPENPFETPIFIMPAKDIGHKGGIA